VIYGDIREIVIMQIDYKRLFMFLRICYLILIFCDTIYNDYMGEI